MNWKVIYTGSRQEKKLANRLREVGIECYLPLYRKLSQWSDRKKWVDWPLFSGYLFVKPTDKQRDQVLNQQGALAYLRYNGQDAVVTDKEIQIIHNLLNSGYSLENHTSPEDLKVGDKVMVVEGPLKGQEVYVIRQNNKEIFLVGFESIGQTLKIALPYHVLEVKR